MKREVGDTEPFDLFEREAIDADLGTGICFLPS